MAEWQIQAVREFNRFYTRQIGLLEEGLLSSRFTLTEVRVLYELARRQTSTATEITAHLALDPGYLSRILKRFEAEGLIQRRRSEADGRSSTLTLSRRGCAEFEPLDRASTGQVAQILEKLSSIERTRLLSSMAVIQRMLGRQAESRDQHIVLRAPAAGDIGWAIERHGTLYADEFGWNHEFEALVAQILGTFLEKQDPQRERAWIAEVDGERTGCVFMVQNAADGQTAQLRCLLVDPRARGLGLGTRLVDACLQFAREAGYLRMILWTNDVLVSARHIYEAAGFELVEEVRHHSFGHDLVGQTWARDL